MNAQSAPVKYAGRTYMIEFSIAVVLYVVAILARPWAVAHAPGAALVTLAKLLPIVPVWLGFFAVVRHYRRIDEYYKFRMLRDLAVGFGVGSCLIISYAFLTDVGLPRLAMIWAWPTLASCWGLSTAITSIRDR